MRFPLYNRQPLGATSISLRPPWDRVLRPRRTWHRQFFRSMIELLLLLLPFCCKVRVTMDGGCAEFNPIYRGALRFEQRDKPGRRHLNYSEGPCQGSYLHPSFRVPGMELDRRPTLAALKFSGWSFQSRHHGYPSGIDNRHHAHQRSRYSKGCNVERARRGPNHQGPFPDSRLVASDEMHPITEPRRYNRPPPVIACHSFNCSQPPNL